VPATGPPLLRKQSLLSEPYFIPPEDIALEMSPATLLGTAHFLYLLRALSTRTCRARAGHSSCGTVYRGQLNGTDAAIRVISAAGRSVEENKAFRRYVATASKLRHVRVAQVMGTCMVGTDWWLVTELMPTSLLKALRAPDAAEVDTCAHTRVCTYEEA
jgi:hypothetical protein